jgi:hypothetical protein
VRRGGCRRCWQEDRNPESDLNGTAGQVRFGKLEDDVRASRMRRFVIFARAAGS